MQNEIYNCEIALPADLGSATDTELADISSALKIDLPFAFLREIGRTLIKNKTKPDKDLLLFFSALRNEAKKNIENLSLAELSADDSEIVNTLNDLYLKAKYIKASNGAPLRFNELISVSSSYLSAIGAHEPKLFSKELDGEKAKFLDENKNKASELILDLSAPLPYGYVKESKNETSNTNQRTLVHGMEILLISANDSFDSDYDERCKKMMTDERIKELCIATDTVDKFGAVGALSKLPCGAYIDFDTLSSPGKVTSLCDLVTGFDGQICMIAAFSRAQELKKLAEEYGLEAVTLAKVLGHPFLIITSNSKNANIEKQLINRAVNMPYPVSLRMEKEVYGAVNTNSNFIFVRKDGHTEEFCKTLLLSETALISALSSDSLSFTDGINIALDTLFLLLAKGADRRHAEFSFKIRSKHGDTSKMVSAILGIYRVMMELCLPDAQSSIEFTSSNDESNMLFCSAGIKADKKLPDIQDSFTRNSIGNKLYLLSFKRLGDTEPAFMPDFAAVRTACDNLYKLISGGNAISVKAFNTTIRKAINEMSGGELCVVPDGEKTIDDSLFMQGFLIETSPKTVINLPLLGRIAAYSPENKDADGCGEDEINMSALSTPD